MPSRLNSNHRTRIVHKLSFNIYKKIRLVQSYVPVSYNLLLKCTCLLKVQSSWTRLSVCSFCFWVIGLLFCWSSVYLSVLDTYILFPPFWQIYRWRKLQNYIKIQSPGLKSNNSSQDKLTNTHPGLEVIQEAYQNCDGYDLSQSTHIHGHAEHMELLLGIDIFQKERTSLLTTSLG